MNITDLRGTHFHDGKFVRRVKIQQAERQSDQIVKILSAADSVVLTTECCENQFSSRCLADTTCDSDHQGIQATAMPAGELTQRRKRFIDDQAGTRDATRTIR